MSVSKAPKPVRPIANFFFANALRWEQAVSDFDERLGTRCFTSNPEAFTTTDYYEREMGKGVMRIFAAWWKLIDPVELIDIKQLAWEIETKHKNNNGGRIVNIDPGIISEGHLILATGKAAFHRPYLGKGVYADLTLIYHNGSYRPLNWTYPDYAGENIISLMNRLRTDYLKDRRDMETLRNTEGKNEDY